MKNILFLFCTLFVLNIKAQYVTIPDPNFVAFLQTNYPMCMNGNQMDTTCANQITHVNVSNLGINDLTGAQYLNLEHLDCSNNNLSSLPTFHFQNSLYSLVCSNNQFTNLPDLSYLNYLQSIDCSNNQLSTLPTLPNSLGFINCSNNPIIALPASLSNIISINFSNTLVSTFPLLNNSTNYYSIKCDSCQITCFPPFTQTIGNLSISGNPCSCIPNYIPTMDASSLSYPLCQENDLINNPNGCHLSKGISGSVYADLNNDCDFNFSDFGIYNFTVKLYDEVGALLRQNFTASNGIYQFPENYGIYQVKIDTTNLPYYILCNYPGLDSLVNVPSDTLIENVNFSLNCKPGFDVGTKSILPFGWVFPGQNHEVKIAAGDMSQFYNFSCASGVSGQVQISVSGPVTYQTNAAGTMTPIVSGNNFTYNIADFGTTDIFSSFGLIFQTDTTAQASDQICVTVSVTPELGDNNTSNNLYEFCYNVMNSYDPNMKEVYPVNVEPGFDEYFTYTIHFQNTGTAPAMNIRLVDTLDANLDLETFQILNYSHYQTANVRNNVLTFHFPNIQLPDSTSNPEGSKGYVQYRIKPKANLALGTQIKNTANIYFDYNEPIVTNTTVNEYVSTNSLHENEQVTVKVYPNPFASSTTVAFGQALTNADMHLYNVYGQEVRKISNFNGTKLSLQKESLTSGIYFLQIRNEQHSQKIKLIITE